MKLLMLLLLISFQAFSQTATTISETSLSGRVLQRMKENLKIRYFSETLGPSIKKWDDNEVASDGTRLEQPVRMFNSFNVRYAFYKDWSFFMSPRFVTVFGDRNELRKTEDDNVVVMDDWQFGVYNIFYKRPNLVYAQRLTHREPFSTYSKNSLIDSQIEWQHDVTWVPAPGWRIIHWNTYRYYVYEPRTNTERYRINFNTLFNYDFNDKWRVQVMYELDMQHRNPNSGRKEREWNYFKSYENHTSFGVGYSPVRDFSIIPFIRAMDVANVRNETTIVGLWLLGKVM